jgi:hypothetical protein
MQNLVAALLYDLDGRLVPDTLVQMLVPDVHATCHYRRTQTPMFFKTHHFPRPEYRRVIHLVRDGRDAMVSYHHMNASLDGEAPDFVDMVSTGKGLFPCRWHEHVEAWMKNPHEAELITLRYEDLHRSPMTELRRLCEFAGLERDDASLARAVETCSFEVMRMKEKTLGWSDPKWPTDKPFVRRGKIGSYHDEMPEEALRIFMQQASPMLTKLGYTTA